MNVFRRGVLFTVGLATTFVLLFAVIGGLGTWFWISASNQIALTATQQRFAAASSAAIARVERVTEPIDTLIGLMVHEFDHPSAARLSVGSLDAPIPSASALRGLCSWCRAMAWSMSQHPQVASVYVGYSNDDFMRVARLDDAKLRASFSAPESAAWGLQIIRQDRRNGKRESRWWFFGADGSAVGTKPAAEAGDYLPSERPWFVQAQLSPGQTIYTDPYVFATSKAIGLTAAQRLRPGSSAKPSQEFTVVGVDFSLSRWSSTLEVAAKELGVNGARMAIVNADRRLLAYSQPQRFDELLLQTIERGKATGTIEMPRPDGVDLGIDLALSYLAPGVPARFQGPRGEPGFGALFQIKQDFGGSSFALLWASEEQLNAELRRLQERAILMVSLLGLALLPMVALLGWSIARPLRGLALQARGISSLAEPQQLPTRSVVREVNELSGAIHKAQHTVANFGKFAPRGVVEDIVRSGATPRLGGKRQSVSLFFSDIEGFSKLSETLSPEDLTLRMTQYFSELAGALIAEGATIDKYIGDSIMAFWNAPREQAGHARMAALGALAATRAGERINAQWQAQGFAAIRTRIGLHVGDIVVGNVGSADRMNYTALGAAVNLASRLEGVNKYLGSSILASDEFMRQAGDSGLAWRAIGRVVPAGTTQAIEVHELRTEPLGDFAREAWQSLMQRWAHATSGQCFAELALGLQRFDAAHGPDPVAQHLLLIAQESASGRRAISSDGVIWLGGK